MGWFSRGEWGAGGDGEFAPQGISGNVWKHSRLSQPGSGEELCYWPLAGTVRGAGKHPTVHKTAPKIKIYSAPNGHHARLRKPPSKIQTELSPYWFPQLAKNMVKGE